MPRYTKEFIGEIKSRLRVSEVVGKFVKLTQRGNEFVGLSPFKNEKTPSFTVNDEKEFYHCFSSAEHGDIFSFLMKHKNMSYPESIEYLAKQAGIDPEKGMIRDPNYVEKDFKGIKKILIEASNYYRSMIHDNSSLKKYLEKRNLNDDIINKFELGYSGSRNDQLYNHLNSKGFNIDDAITAGLIKKSNHQRSEYYDFFRNRLIFPIKDHKSDIIAFGGRALDNSNIKYINSADSPLFKKSFQLYNINLAIEENRKIKDLIIVEGYMDVITLYQNNFKTTVAPLGTALTIYQLERAWKLCENPIIMFDGDEAGQKASQRVSMLAIDHLKPDLSLRFCILPKNYDPDDFILKNSPKELSSLIDNSLSLSEFIWKNELEKEDTSTPEKKAGFEYRIKQIVSRIGNKTVKEYYNKLFRDKLFQFKKPNNTLGFDYGKNVFSKVSKEISSGERLDSSKHDSVIREKIIILTLIKNPFLAVIYAEDLGKMRFNDLLISNLVSNILEFTSSNSDKNLENFDLKSYLLARGLSKEINYIFQSSLLNTYSSMINNDKSSVERGFEGLLELQRMFSNEGDLLEAFSSFEENMDEESFENFLRIKRESLNKK